MPDSTSNEFSNTANEPESKQCFDDQEEEEELMKENFLRQMHKISIQKDLPPPFPALVDVPLAKFAEMKLIRINFKTLKFDNEAGALVPLCIAGPLIHLLEITRDNMQINPNNDNLFTDILSNKASESDENFRNHMIVFMLTNPHLGYNEYVQLVGHGCRSFCFQLVGHILGVWESKLCPVSNSHCEIAERLNFFDVRQPFSPIRRIKLKEGMLSSRVSASSDADIDQFTLSLVNELRKEMYCDLENIADTTVKNTVKLTFLVFCSLIRLYLEEQTKKSLDNPLDIINIVRQNANDAYKIMKTLAEVIAVPLIRVSDIWYAGYCRSRGPTPPEIKDQLAQRLFIHFLMINSVLVFQPESVNLPDVLLHVIDKDSKSQCICQYLDIKMLFNHGISNQSDLHPSVPLK
ncbi:hypothetical protein Aperf_G00000124286 [Anoplocephala perfoliata]